MTLKDRIVRVLKKKGIGYEDLCTQLDFSSEEVDNFIEQKNVKILESISKLLGIPLYSFYNNPKDIPPSAPKKRHYTEDIWKDDEET